MTRTAMPSPAEVADALDVAALGGDLVRLAEVCTAKAATTPEPGKTRLRRAAAALAFAADLADQPGHSEEGAETALDGRTSQREP